VANQPEPEIDVTESLVRALLAEQAPQYASLPLRQLARGWDNTNWRVGDDLIARIPHREMAAALIGHEQRWLPVLAQQLTLVIPVPTFAGGPSESLDYPWSWSVVPWTEGIEAAGAPLADQRQVARTLGRFFAELHVPGPPDAPLNPYRGGDIGERAESVEERAQLHSDLVDIDAVRALFHDAASAPADQKPDRRSSHGPRWGLHAGARFHRRRHRYGGSR